MDGSEALRRAVFLDRDGVLNASEVVDGTPHSPAAVEDLLILPGVAEACHLLRTAGFLLLVVTNQPDIARGSLTPQVLDALHSRLRETLPLDDILVCPHDDADACPCRKPEPGLLLEGARRWSVDIARSFMVGDRWRDVEAGRRAGCTTIFVDRGYAEKQPPEFAAAVRDLRDAVSWILRCDPRGRTEESLTS
jgi:D-glycero-D-manno-heptose 1,7-bisphosphate phosphatase